MKTGANGSCATDWLDPATWSLAWEAGGAAAAEVAASENKIAEAMARRAFMQDGPGFGAKTNPAEAGVVGTQVDKLADKNLESGEPTHKRDAVHAAVAAFRKRRRRGASL